MTDESQQPEGRDGVLSSLNTAIDGLNLAKELSSITPAKAVFGSVAILITMIRVGFPLACGETFRAHISRQDTMANEQDYVDLGLSCADICKALERGMGEKKLDDFNKSVRDAINQLTVWVEPAVHISFPSAYHVIDGRTVAEIQRKIIKRSERHTVSRFLHARTDKDTIASWKLDLSRILVVFNVGSTRFRSAVTDFLLFRPSLP